MTPATGIESQAPSDTGTPATALRPGFARSVTMIEPRPGWRMLDLRELWRYRDLAFVLAARDVKVRYKQTALGVVWVLVGPLLSTGLFTFIFGGLAGIPSDGLPYPVFCFAGVQIWQLFSRSIQQSMSSLVGNAGLIQKVYFPRLVLPMASQFGLLIDYVIGLGMLAALMAIYGVAPNPMFLLMPLFVVMALVGSLGVGLILGALNVHYRDVGQVAGLVLQVWMYATPVVYPLALVARRRPALMPWFLANPATGLVEGYRWCVAPSAPFPAATVAVSASFSVVLLVAGLFVFRRLEKTFADIV